MKSLVPLPPWGSVCCPWRVPTPCRPWHPSGNGTGRPDSHVTGLRLSSVAGLPAGPLVL